MKTELFCLGHHITAHNPSGNFDLVEGVTDPNVLGPPPHHHTGYNELFFVLEGKMEFMVDGKLVVVEPGESIDLPQNTLHIFKTIGTTPCRWLNMHSLEGFLSFLEECGVNANEENEFEKSVDQSVINNVIQQAASYDMHILMP